MPAKKQSNSDGVEADGSSNGFCFSETESKIIHAVLQRTDPSMNSIIDWEKVREDLASASVESTRKRFRQISLKRGWFKDEHNVGMSTPNGKNAATRTPGSKNKKVPGGDNDDGAANDTPVKKRKTATPKKVKAEPDTTEGNGQKGQDGASIDANGMDMNLSFDEV